MATPLVILASGQSNFWYELAFGWSPSVNAQRWNYDNVDGHTGTAFAALVNTTVNISDKVASDLAVLTGRPVYLINVSEPGIAISHWMVGGTAPNMYLNLTNNVPAALAALGVTQIDLFLWWQGESDAGSVTYAADFETVITRLKTNSWFPATTPILICGLEPDVLQGAGVGLDAITTVLQARVAAVPQLRIFLNSGVILRSYTYWDITSPYHMNALGYYTAGAMAAVLALEGIIGLADWPPKKNAAFTFRMPGLVSQANPSQFQVNPTLAAGDVLVSQNGGNPANITSLPTSVNGTNEVAIALSQAEMNNDEVVVYFHDVAGNEWMDWGVTIFPVTRQLIDLSYLAGTRVRKNTALPKFSFYMVDSLDQHSPKTGLAVNCQRSIDGGAFANCTVATATEVGNGFYYVDLSAADLNGSVISLRFAASGAEITPLTLITQE